MPGENLFSSSTTIAFNGVFTPPPFGGQSLSISHGGAKVKFDPAVPEQVSIAAADVFPGSFSSSSNPGIQMALVGTSEWSRCRAMFAISARITPSLVCAFLAALLTGCARREAPKAQTPPPKASGLVDLKLSGPFVLVSPNKVPAADRPSLTLTVEYKGMAGTKADITLTSAGTGEVEFEENPLKDVMVGTTRDILVFGKSPSAAQNGTRIEARINTMSANPDGMAFLT